MKLLQNFQQTQRLAHDAFDAWDDAHSGGQALRFHAPGKTHEGRKLHITFTLRHDDTLIRVISERDMQRKERVVYEQAN